MNAASENLISTQEEGLNEVRQVKEDIRNAWESLQIAREQADYLRDQANILQEFLELARQEREMGKRSLLDVLSAETSLINARSDAAAAETDVQIAAYQILRGTGQLNLNLFTSN